MSKPKDNQEERDSLEIEPEDYFDGEEIDDTDENCVDQLKKVKKRLKECEQEKLANLSGWQRAQADYVNQKNDFEKRKAEYLKLGSEKMARDLLTVMDSFQMAFANKQAWEETPENWRKGIEYIHSQLINTLKDHGIVKIEALGQEFDPARHESIEAVDTDEPKEDHRVIEVVKDGYTFHDKIIRPAQVKIAIYKK